MDQSSSLQDQDEVWLAKLALLGCTIDVFGSYYFIYVNGSLKICGQNLSSMSAKMLDSFQKGLYQ